MGSTETVQKAVPINSLWCDLEGECTADTVYQISETTAACRRCLSKGPITVCPECGHELRWKYDMNSELEGDWCDNCDAWQNGESVGL